MGAQGWLLGREEPAFDAGFSGLVRRDLAEGAWVELVPGWLCGHATLFDELAASTDWRTEDRRMYDNVVAVPRLYASLPPGRRPEVVEQMRRALGDRYRTDFLNVSAAMYRGGRDSVAWHGDYVARELPGDSLVATVSVGAPRRFLLRPTGGGRSAAFMLGCGDLIVMGGTCQRTYQHSVPKVAHAEPRIAIMFRPLWQANDVT
jgi:alkylated DNA repair dioxygenase AlkB